MVAERNARGTFAFPSELFVLNENTYDTIFNGGVNPVVHLGNNTITFNPGLQFTIRRDTRSGTDLNQNLFRQYLYVNTSSFGNWVSFSGSMIREAGPFTEQDLHSEMLRGPSNSRSDGLGRRPHSSLDTRAGMCCFVR